MAMAIESSLQLYLEQINTTDLLTADQEKELAHRIINEGDPEARDLMIRANLRLVVNIAKKFTGRGMPLVDLIEEGNLGLLRAVEGFDPAHEVRFSTYASWWIKQSIKRALINAAQPVHIPAYMVEMIGKWKQASLALEEKLGRTPGIDEMAAAMEMPVKKVRIIRRAVKAFSSTGQMTSDDGSMPLNDMLEDEKTPPPEHAMFAADELEMIGRLLEKIDERQATVLRLRFGLDNQDPMTLKEIGKRVGLTRERVRQIEKEALAKLNEILTQDDA